MSFVIRIFVLALVALSVSADARAQAGDFATSNIPYVGVDVGLSLSSAEVNTSDNDVPSNCDGHYDGEGGIERGANASGFSGLLGTGMPCNAANDTWTNDFDSSIGHTVGVVAGVSKLAGFPVRAELEYFYRDNSFDERATPDWSGAKLHEFSLPMTVNGARGQMFGELEDIVSHNVFANVYYDLELDSSSFTPYIGAGIGWARTKFGMTHFFQRNKSADEGAAAATGHPSGHVDATCESTGTGASATSDCVLEVLEGTVSYGRETHDDSTIAFQVLLGFDYPLSDRIDAGLKLRWAYYGDIEGERTTWDTLRSHGSTVVPTEVGAADVSNTLGRPNTITYRSELKSDQVWGAALSLKYKFF